MILEYSQRSLEFLATDDSPRSKLKETELKAMGVTRPGWYWLSDISDLKKIKAHGPFETKNLAAADEAKARG